MVAKAYPGEKVGVFALRDGEVSVVEYSELGAELAEAKDSSSGRLLYNWRVSLNVLCCRSLSCEVMSGWCRHQPQSRKVAVGRSSLGSQNRSLAPSVDFYPALAPVLLRTRTGPCGANCCVSMWVVFSCAPFSANSMAEARCVGLNVCVLAFERVCPRAPCMSPLCSRSPAISVLCVSSRACICKVSGIVSELVGAQVQCVHALLPSRLPGGCGDETTYRRPFPHRPQVHPLS